MGAQKKPHLVLLCEPDRCFRSLNDCDLDDGVPAIHRLACRMQKWRWDCTGTESHLQPRPECRAADRSKLRACLARQVSRRDHLLNHRRFDYARTNGVDPDASRRILVSAFFVMPERRAVPYDMPHGHRGLPDLVHNCPAPSSESDATRISCFMHSQMDRRSHIEDAIVFHGHEGAISVMKLRQFKESSDCDGL